MLIRNIKTRVNPRRKDKIKLIRRTYFIQLAPLRAKYPIPITKAIEEKPMNNAFMLSIPKERYVRNRFITPKPAER